MTNKLFMLLTRIHYEDFCYSHSNLGQLRLSGPGHNMTKAFSVNQPSTKSKLKKLLLKVTIGGSLGIKFFVLFSIKWFRLTYLFVFTTTLIIGFVHSAYGRSSTVKFDFAGKTILTLVDVVSYLFLTFANLSTVHAIWGYEKNKESVMVLVKYIGSKKKGYVSVTSYILICIGIIGIFANVLTFLPFKSISFYQYYVFQDLQFLYLHLTLQAQCEFADALKSMFSDLNAEFKKAFTGVRQVSSVIDGVDLFAATNVNAIKPNWPKIKAICLYKPTNHQYLKNISKKHNDLCHISDNFNRYLASVTFFSIVGIIANIIRALIFLIHVDLVEVLSGRLKLPFDIWISNMVYNISWIVSMIGQAVLISNVGHQLESEGQKTGIYCFKLLSQLRFNEENKEESFFKQLLICLATQAKARCPELKGKNGFKVNYDTLGVVIMNVIALTVVCTQFILNDHKKAGSIVVT